MKASWIICCEHRTAQAPLRGSRGRAVPRRRCSPLPAFCTWSVRLATKTRPGAPTYFLWDLGFLIRRVLGVPWRACGHCRGMGLQSGWTSMQVLPARPRPFPRKAPLTGSRWACLGGTLISPLSGMLPARGWGGHDPSDVPDSQPSPARTGQRGLTSRQALLPHLPACWFWPLTFAWGFFFRIAPALW